MSAYYRMVNDSDADRAISYRAIAESLLAALRNKHPRAKWAQALLVEHADFA